MKRKLFNLLFSCTAVLLALSQAFAAPAPDIEVVELPPYGEEQGSEGAAYLLLSAARGSYATVTEAVNGIVANMQAEGVTDEYEMAVWLHDWLIYNANYSPGSSPYPPIAHQPDGVLLQGSGVCQSYAEAYKLLLDKVGITSQVLEAPEMNHAWNLLYLDDEWCHVDITWDDSRPGGYEHHGYFGLNDDMMKRDHVWNYSKYPAATSSKNLYVARQGEGTVANEQELITYLNALAEAKTESITLNYIGDQADFNIMTMFRQWYDNYNWKYGLVGLSYRGTAYQMSAEITYGNPWRQPGPLAEPVQGASFDLTGPDGSYQMNEQTTILVFGRSTCSYTQSFLTRFSEHLDALENAGIRVLVNLVDCTSESQLNSAQIVQDFPAYTYTYGDSTLMWNNLRRVGISDSIYFPAIFIYNNAGMLTFVSTNSVSNNTMQSLLDTAYDTIHNRLVSSGTMAGKNSAQVKWYFYNSGELKLSGLPEDHQLCIAAYNQKDQLADLKILTSGTPSITLEGTGVTYRLFWVDSSFLPQSNAFPVSTS